MPMSCHSCPKRSQRTQERAGVGPCCSALTHLCQGHMQPSCRRRGEHSPTLQHTWGPAFLNGGRFDPSRLPSRESPKPHAWAQPEGKDKATTAWALGPTPHAPPSAATSPAGSAVSPWPSQTCLQKPGRALLPPSTPAGLCSPPAPPPLSTETTEGTKKREARGGPAPSNTVRWTYRRRNIAQKDRGNSLNRYSSFYKKIFDSIDKEAGVLYSEGLRALRSFVACTRTAGRQGCSASVRLPWPGRPVHLRGGFNQGT